MSRALYRTYRSRSFDEVVGQSHVTELLKNAIATDKIAHAYLLTGPRGVGKTSVARIIAHEVNGLKYSEDQHLDIIEIDAASNRRIDDIRDLREKVHITPSSAKYKVYIIDEVHMLTGESFNALLKTLEEPPEHAIFILATTEVHKVPATIISRTQRFHLRPATVPDIKKQLDQIAKQESIEADPDALELIAVHAAGSFRDSVSLLDQLSGLSEKITTELVESVLGMAETKRIKAVVEAIETRDISTLVSELEHIQSAGVSPIVLTDQLNRFIAEKAKSNHNLYQLLDALTEVPRAHDPQLKLIATLVRFTKPVTHKSVAATHVTKSPAVSAKTTELRIKAVERAESKKAQDVEQKSTTVTAEVKENMKAPGRMDWESVLSTLKKHHAPLYSVVSRATMTYDEATNILSLSFAYVLHRKKLENPQYRKQLGSVIHDLCGLNPEMKITDTKSTMSLNAEAKAIADIMGGGEPISGTI